MLQYIKNDGSEIFSVENISLKDNRIDINLCIDYKTKESINSTKSFELEDSLKDELNEYIIETLKENGEMVNYIKLDEYKTWSDNQEYVLRIFLKHSEIAYLVINFPTMYDKVKNNEKIPFDNGYYIMLRTLDLSDRIVLEAMGIVVDERGV